MPKSIKFSDNELGFLRNHYEQELIDAEVYVGEIRKILSKLGQIQRETPATGNVEKKRRGRPAGAKNKKKAAKAEAKPAVKVEAKPAPVKAEKKKPGPKPRIKKAAKKKPGPKPTLKVKKTVKKVTPKPAPVAKPEGEATSSTAI